MIKNKKPIALLIAVLMLMSNFMGLLGNISLALQNSVKLVIEADNDSDLKLYQNENDLETSQTGTGTVLKYTYHNGNEEEEFVFRVKDGDSVKTITKVTEEPEQGHFHDTYVVDGVSNKDVYISSPNMDSEKISLNYNDRKLLEMSQKNGENADWETDKLHVLDEESEDATDYRICIGPKQQQGGGEQPDLSNVDFAVDFGQASWEVNGVTVTATIGGNAITEHPTLLKGNTEIALSNFNSETMEVRITEQTGENPFWTTLRVAQNGITRIVDYNAENLPGGPYNFEVVGHGSGSGNDTDMADLMYTVNFGTGTFDVDDNQVTVKLRGENNSLINVNGTTQVKGDQEIVLTGFNPDTMEVGFKTVEENKPEENWYGERLIVDENGVTSIVNKEKEGFLPNDKVLKFYVGFRTSNPPEWNLPDPNTTANVTITSSQAHSKTYAYGRISINGFGIDLEEYERQEDLSNVPETTTINDFAYFYDANDNEKVIISFGALFLKKYVGKVVVNNEEFVIYDESRPPEENLIDYNNRTDWLNHYRGQMVGFDVEVAKADHYDIVADLVDMDRVYIGNFLWTDNPDEEFIKDEQGNIINDENGQPIINDEFIGHSRLELLEVNYQIDLNCDGTIDNNEKFTLTENDLLDQEHLPQYIEYDPYGRDGHTRSLVVPENAICKMRITPKYGYQVTEFGVNGSSLYTGEAISEFDFVIGEGNFHIGAKVTPVDDVVSSSTDKVKSGTIKIGANEIDSGTVVLSVDDVNLNDDKKEGFENAAGDYEIDSYLDISLDQVFYKGTSENVWSNAIHELNSEATIKLELDEDLSNKDVIVVHNVDNGDNYDVIEIDEYDPETNTIKFKTDSFSNYAIAVKDKTEEDQEESEEPAEGQEKYTVTEGDFTVIFIDDEGHEFELEIKELLHLTPEQLKEMGMSVEE